MRAVFIGEEPLATGFFLAGVDCQPSRRDRAERWRQLLDARQRCDLVILTAEFARDLRSRIDQLLIDGPMPPVLVLPETGGQGRSHAIDSVRRSLGLEEAGS